MSEPFVHVTSAAVLLPFDDVDTDQVIPARYLKAVSRDGLAEALFADWRRTPDGALRPDFPLNRPEARGRSILVAGHNFGCGSSREHAVWALTGAGFRVVVAGSFADIFKGNAVKNGLLPLRLVAPQLAALHEALRADDAAVLDVDLEACRVALPGGEVATFEVDPFARRMLLAGSDELGYLLGHEAAIGAYERAHPARISTLDT